MLFCRDLLFQTGSFKQVNVCLLQGRLNELMSQIRMQNHLAGTRNDVSYQMDPSLQEEIKHVSWTK